jgi:hypothetical protein
MIIINKGKGGVTGRQALQASIILIGIILLSNWYQSKEISEKIACSLK